MVQMRKTKPSKVLAEIKTAKANLKNKKGSHKRRWLKGTPTARALLSAFKQGDEDRAREILAQHPDMLEHRYFEKDGGFFLLHHTVENAAHLVKLLVEHELPRKHLVRNYPGFAKPLDLLKAQGEDTLVQWVEDNIAPEPPSRGKKKKKTSIKKQSKTEPFNPSWLIRAVEQGDRDGLEKLLHQYPGAAYEDFFEKNPLIDVTKIASRTLPDMVPKLLEFGFGSVKRQDEMPALLWRMIKENKLKKSQEILRKNPKILQHSFYTSGPGLYALKQAAKTCPKIIPSLIKSGLKLDTLNKRGYRTQVIETLEEKGHDDIAASLQEKAPRHKRRWLKGTPTARALFSAFKRGDEDRAREILAQHPSMLEHRYFEHDGGFFLLQETVENAPHLVKLLVEHELPRKHLTRHHPGSAKPLNLLKAQGEDALVQWVEDNIAPEPAPRKKRSKQTAVKAGGQEPLRLLSEVLGKEDNEDKVVKRPPPPLPPHEIKIDTPKRPAPPKPPSLLKQFWDEVGSFFSKLFGLNTKVSDTRRGKSSGSITKTPAHKHASVVQKKKHQRALQGKQQAMKNQN